MKAKTGRPDKPFAPLHTMEKRMLHIPLGAIRGVHFAGEFEEATKTGDYTAAGEMVLLVDATATDITITLPAASTNPFKVYYIKKIDTSGHKVTIGGNTVAEKIDDELTFEIVVPYTCITVICDESNWWII